MAKKQELRGFYQKRKILFGAKTSPERMRQTGERFMAAGRYDDALEFFERCEAEDLTRRIAAEAMKAGDAPLYMRAKKVLKEQIADGEWAGLAANAENAGSYAMAYVAHLKAGREEEADRVRRLMSGLAGEEPDAEQQPAAPGDEPAEG